MGLISLLRSLKEHTYTPNSFYDAMIAHTKAIGNLDFKPMAVFTKMNAVALAVINAETLTQEIEIQLQDSEGNLLDWYTGAMPVTFAGSTAGVVEDSEGDAFATVDLVEGKASVVAHFTGVWVNDETATISVGNAGTVMGKTLTKKDMVVLKCASA